MKKNVIIFLTVIFPFMLSQTFGQWEKFVIDNDINVAVYLGAADLDGDSKLDLVVTNAGGSQLIWYQNNFPQWTKHIIDDIFATFAFIGDMDGDDTLDVVANLYFDGKMVWYENNHPTWTQHIIDNSTYNADFTLVADFDNNDTLDVVTSPWEGGGPVLWYENNHPQWTEHIIESFGSKTGSLNATDVNSDGLLDIVATRSDENRVDLFINENNGLTWTKFTIDDDLSPAWCLSSG
ncbi:MAG: VCBS repeat-containing protein, partial [Bacteroidales bacterium]